MSGPCRPRGSPSLKDLPVSTEKETRTQSQKATRQLVSDSRLGLAGSSRLLPGPPPCPCSPGWLAQRGCPLCWHLPVVSLPPTPVARSCRPQEETCSRSCGTLPSVSRGSTEKTGPTPRPPPRCSKFRFRQSGSLEDIGE